MAGLILILLQLSSTSAFVLVPQRSILRAGVASVPYHYNTWDATTSRVALQVATETAEEEESEPSGGEDGEPFDAATMTSIDFATLVEQVKNKLRDEWQVLQMKQQLADREGVDDKWANDAEYRNKEYDRYQMVAFTTYDNIVRRYKEKRRLTPAEQHEIKWLQCYEQLLDYKIEHGGESIANLSLDNTGLGQWVEDQRTLRRLGQVPRHHHSLLDDIGFQNFWYLNQDNGEEEWYQMYEELKFYYDELDKVEASKDNPFQMLPIQSLQLKSWEAQQRELYAKQELPPPLQALVSGIHGFDWNVLEGADREKHNYQDLPSDDNKDLEF